MPEWRCPIPGLTAAKENHAHCPNCGGVVVPQTPGITDWRAHKEVCHVCGKEGCSACIVPSYILPMAYKLLDLEGTTQFANAYSLQSHRRCEAQLLAEGLYQREAVKAIAKVSHE